MFVISPDAEPEFIAFLLSKFRLDGDRLIGPSGKELTPKAGKRGYVEITAIYRGRPRKVKFPRLKWLLATGGLPDSIDHINGDPSDNRLANLRAASPTLQQGNRKPTRGSRFKGVQKRPKGWSAVVDGREYGPYIDEETAARVYDDYAEQKWGAFARLNFPRQIKRELRRRRAA